MAELYVRKTLVIEDRKPWIRAINEEDYHVAITFQEVDTDEVTEVCLTAEEVKAAYDLLFNRKD